MIRLERPSQSCGGFFFAALGPVMVLYRERQQTQGRSQSRVAQLRCAAMLTLLWVRR
jgi:hypothetical protein